MCESRSMLVLAIDTCGSAGSVALARLGGNGMEVLGESALPGRSYSAQLVPAIRVLLEAGQAAAADLGAVVVTKGPGSFTGIRIGVSTAKGLAEARSVPIVAVSRLAVLAHKAGTRAAALDASRREFYLGDYGVPAEERLLSFDGFAARAAALGAELGVSEAAVHDAAPAATLVAEATAADALEFALPRLRACAFDDPATLDGEYLRRSDAEIFAKTPRP